MSAGADAPKRQGLSDAAPAFAHSVTEGKAMFQLPATQSEIPTYLHTATVNKRAKAPARVQTVTPLKPDWERIRQTTPPDQAYVWMPGPEEQPSAGLIVLIHRADHSVSYPAARRKPRDEAEAREHVQQLNGKIGVSPDQALAVALEYFERPRYAKEVVPSSPEFANKPEIRDYMITTDLMEPRYRRGDTICVEKVDRAEVRQDYVFARADDTHLVVRTLVRETAAAWVVRQYNPDSQTRLLKSEWPRFERVAWRFSR